ncbi:MAG TPA: hypothetical protein VJ938_04155 [Acidimicrobiia bacterium]|nr:hypothetical protein [Acidimicrobiia bacterium]
MPPPLPDRLRLEVRLGRDDDIEEWLATDLSLDRPVLIRFLGPESSEMRRAEFLASVRGAATANHPHLAAVYMVEDVENGAYSASEWTGGATLASRLEAGDTIDPDEFLPNAAGLAGALAVLHENGVVHGGIDLGAVTYTVAHPAKLGAFGRRSRGASQHEDVRSLAETLEEGLTGSPAGGAPPSESIDGLDPAVDSVLRAGRRNAMGARALAEAFASAPTPRRPQPESTRPSRRLLIVAALLVVAAGALVGLGRLFTPSGSPSLPPPASPGAGSGPSTTAIQISTTTTTLAPVVSAEVTVSNPATLDPFGGGGENDQQVEGLTDDDLETAWRTEVYLDPLPLLKPGVGVTVDVDGTPRSLDLLGLTSGATLRLAWSATGGTEPDDFETVARLQSQPGATSIQLPAREDGTWLIWFTDLPADGDDYSASLSEIRFRP